MKLLISVLLSLFVFSLSNAQTYKVLESNLNYIKISFDFSNQYNLKDSELEGRIVTHILGEEYSLRNPGEPWLPSVYVSSGIPANSNPEIKILSIEKQHISNKFILPYPDSLNQAINTLRYNEKIYSSNSFFPELPAEISNIYTMRYINVAAITVYPYQFNPISRELVFNKKITIQMNFNVNPGIGIVSEKINDILTEEYIQSSLINPSEAKLFVSKLSSSKDKSLQDTVWYNPQKIYYKIYLRKKGVYRISFNDLVAAGITPFGAIQQGKFEIINNGKPVPIDIVDVNQNGLFDSSDYFQFIGQPPTPHNQYTYYNIYNNQNVYWFSYQADSMVTYKKINGYPTNFDFLLTSTVETLHFENDYMYEPLGYAPNDKRDFWYWDRAEARDGNPYYIFTEWIKDSIAYVINRSRPQMQFRANLHGMTTGSCNFGHSAFVNINTKKIGTIKWNGSESATFTKTFFAGNSILGDSVIIYVDSNKIEIGCDGDVCTTKKDDIIRVNWFEIDYWRYNYVKGKYYNFKSPPNEFADNLYYLFGWEGNDMKIYIPERNEMITNPYFANDVDKSVLFADTIQTRTEYFCFSSDYYLIPDSIVKDNPSNLRNTQLAADYLIITHKKFTEVAQRLASFRSANLPRILNPRITIVDIQDIYDEFSYGLLNPIAVKKFVKYAFDNWEAPALSYVVLLGDMSYDYRGIYAGSRPNFIPSIMIHSPEYGQAPSDNEFACVAGDDIVPDLAIGRLSCETVDEGNILVDKIMNYPADNSKVWKENVLLISSGLNAQDELQFGFNDENLYLDDNYLLPNGFTSFKVFRYPNKPRHFPYQGEGPKIREGFNKGAILANYYGHGGGAQWDLVFTNDDIYQLNNNGRLPLIVSVTCYTAHYDNQDIFGEKFNKVPGKGSLGFFGSSGLTWWQAGVAINKVIFNEIFNKRNYVFGLAALKAKQSVSSSGFMGTQISLLTLLGDPAVELAFPKYPDFEIKSADITFSPSNPLKDDTVKIFIKYRNLGVVFPNDSVTIQIFENSVDPQNLIAEVKRGSFGQSDSIEVLWTPNAAGLYSLIVQINETDTLWEIDHTDNVASNSIAVYSFGKPNVIRPVNGHFQTANQVSFIFSDIGSFFGRDFTYLVEIDTSVLFNSPLKISSPALKQNNGIVRWESPALSVGEYYWIAVIFDETDTNSTDINTFSITERIGRGFSATNTQLKNFITENMFYSYSNNSLVLNTDTLPPYPSNKRFLDSINISLPVDANGLTTFTTDGTYFYFGHLPFYRFGEPTKIYKIGSGLNNTIRGFNYGTVSDYRIFVKSQIFYHSDGFIYAATGDNISLLRLDLISGDTSRIILSDELLPTEDGLLRDSGYYVISDGEFVYNLSAGYGSYRNKYVMRKFDPQQNWKKVGDDVIFDGTSFPGFSAFFVVDNYLYVFESAISGYMRRYRINDGFFEEEWLVASPVPYYYTWTYDWINNLVYSSTFRPLGAPYKPGFHKFVGKFQDAFGMAMSQEIGPSVKWKSCEYDIDVTGSTGIYTVKLIGKNKNTNQWDTLFYNLPSSQSLDEVSASTYDYLKFLFEFIDSSYNPSAPLKLKSLLVNYDSNPEIVLFPNDLTFSADTLLQGFPIDMELKVRNLGYSDAENLIIKFYLNDADSSYFTDSITIEQDSTKIIKHTIPTSNLIFENKFKVFAFAQTPEFYSFNNTTENGFFVARDSIKPFFSVTIDGKEIVNGDIVSATPEILLILRDNSPLPLDTSLFTIIFDNVPLSFTRNDIQLSYTPYPNSEFVIKWNPKLRDGRHTLEVLAKDASGNFFDSTSSRTVFYVYNNPDLLYVYNYPNPFKNDTYFTFELRGSVVPEDFQVKIYTVAGRLIKQFSVPPSEMNIGFNRIYWDGRDEDGDEIANGIYFYKVISRLNNETKIITQKLAKVK